MSNDTREALSAKCKALADTALQMRGNAAQAKLPAAYIPADAARADLLAAIDELAALTEQPAPQQAGAMTAIASRNLRAYLIKASFASNVDREAALNCVSVLEEAAQPAAQPSVPKGYIKADQAYDTRKLFDDLCDVVAEANAVDTVIGRPDVLRRKLNAIRDHIGHAVNGHIPLRAAPSPAPVHEAPDGAHEALQRMIEDGLQRGPASREDAKLVAKYRRTLLTPRAPSPVPAVQPEAVAELVGALGELLTLEADGRHAAESSIEAWERARAVHAKHGQPQGGRG